MKKYLFLIGITASLTAIASASMTWDAERISVEILKEQKYHDIQLLWIQPGKCIGTDDFDYNRTGFRAVSSKGHLSYGIICHKQITFYFDIPSVKLLHVKGYHDVEVLKSFSMQCPDKRLDHHRLVFRAVSPQNHIVTGSVCNGEIFIN